MNGPPKGVEASELWRKLSERPRPTIVVDFPGKGESPGQLKLRILTESELHSCRANADAAAKEFSGRESKMGDLGYEDIYRNELALQLVAMSARAIEDDRLPAFPSPKHARQRLTTDEIAVLCEAYKRFKIEAGPIVSELDDATMEAWIRMLQEGGSRVPLAKLSGEAQSDLILYLVSKLGTTSTGTGSAGSLPEEPSIAPTVASELVDESERSR